MAWHFNWMFFCSRLLLVLLLLLNVFVNGPIFRHNMTNSGPGWHATEDVISGSFDSSSKCHLCHVSLMFCNCLLSPQNAVLLATDGGRLTVVLIRKICLLGLTQAFQHVLYHHHHHPRISSRHKSWNKTSGPLCVTYYTTAVMSVYCRMICPWLFIGISPPRIAPIFSWY